MSALPSLRRGWCPGALRPMRTGDGLLVRLRITGGIVPVELARAIAAAAGRHGNGLLDLSGRANLQIRGVSDATLPGLIERLAALGLLDDEPDAEAVRNVLASPLAGLAPDALLDIRPIVRLLERRLAGDPALRGLPSKFGFLVDDGGSPGLADARADIRFDAVPGPDGPLIRIGLGGTATSARFAGACRPDEVPAVAARLAAAVLARPSGEDGPQRLVHGARDLPAAAFRDMAVLVPASSVREAPPIGPFAVGSIAVVGLGAPFGRFTAESLAGIAAAAETAGATELRLTPWRVVLVPNPAPERIDALLAACEPHAITRPDDARLAVTTCAGAPGCERATTPTHEDARALAGTARALAPHGVTLHLSGCRKGCARPEATAATLVGDEGRYGLVLDGGAADAPVLFRLSAAEAAVALLRLARGALHP